MDTSERARRLKLARLQAGYASAAEAARKFGWNRNTYASNENGNAPFSFRRAGEYAQAYGVEPHWLYAGEAPEKPAQLVGRLLPHLVPVVGTVDETGVVTELSASEPPIFVPLPPGGGRSSVALIVSGRGLNNLLDPGGLVYFEDAQRPAAAEAIDQLAVAETYGHEIVLARLRRGSRLGRYKLVALDSDATRSVRLKWASPVTVLIPPVLARKLVSVLPE